MNTKIGYLYRDASNYKTWNEVIVAGEFTKDDLQLIEATLDIDGLFIPEQIGLPLVRPDDDFTEDDHCFAELSMNDISTTNEASTIDTTWNDIVANFQKVMETGWNSGDYGGF